MRAKAGLFRPDGRIVSTVALTTPALDGPYASVLRTTTGTAMAWDAIESIRPSLRDADGTARLAEGFSRLNRQTLCPNGRVRKD